MVLESTTTTWGIGRCRTLLSIIFVSGDECLGKPNTTEGARRPSTTACFTTLSSPTSSFSPPDLSTQRSRRDASAPGARVRLRAKRSGALSRHHSSRRAPTTSCFRGVAFVSPIDSRQETRVGLGTGGREPSDGRKEGGEREGSQSVVVFAKDVGDRGGGGVAAISAASSRPPHAISFDLKSHFNFLEHHPLISEDGGRNHKLCQQL